jgi:hypothetical protein
MRLSLVEPLLHSLAPSTRITDANGDNVQYEHSLDPLWLSNQGVNVGLLVMYNWGGSSMR